MLFENLPSKFIAASVLAVFVTVIAYIHSVRIKTLIYCLPVPFVCAYLVTGRHIDTTNVIGVLLMVSYHWTVYFSRMRLSWPMAVAIPLGVCVYLSGARLAMATTEWPIVYAAFPVGVAVLTGAWLYRPEHEQGHRSRAPVWVKLPSVFAIAVVMYTLTPLFGGAVTMFPYAGTLTSYEMRKSLRTLAGQVTINSIAFVFMMVVMWGVQDRLPRLGTLGVGMVVVVGTLGVIYAMGLGRPAGFADVPEQS
ncbi:MAG: hypothetical protein GC164_00660 [Phycisphaera sp.]|nr:hypothetical protein [Phycisphaera sp.]